MNNRILFVLLLAVASPAFASESGFWTGFVNYITEAINSLVTLFTENVPDMLSRFTAWAIEFAVYLKLYLFYKAALFAFSVAQHIANDLHLSEYLMSAISALPQNVQAVGRAWGLPDCINFIVHCWLTRFVMTFMGW